MYPDLVADQKGRWHVVFQDDGPGHFEVFYSQVFPTAVGEKTPCATPPVLGGGFGTQVGATATLGQGEDDPFIAYGDNLLKEPTPATSGPITARTGFHRLFRDFHAGNKGEWTGVSRASDRDLWALQDPAAPAPTYVAPAGHPLAGEGDFGAKFSFKNIAIIAQAHASESIGIELVLLPIKPKCAPPSLQQEASPRLADLIAAPKRPLPPTFVDPVDISRIVANTSTTTEDDLPPRFTLEDDANGTVFTNIVVAGTDGTSNRLVFSQTETPGGELKFILGQVRCGTEPCAVKVSSGGGTARKPGIYRIRLQVWQGGDFVADPAQAESAFISATKTIDKQFEFGPGEDMSRFSFGPGELVVGPKKYLFFVPIPVDTEFHVDGVGGGHSMWSTSGDGVFSQYYVPYTVPPSDGLKVPVYYEGTILEAAADGAGGINEPATTNDDTHQEPLADEDQSRLERGCNTAAFASKPRLAVAPADETNLIELHDESLATSVEVSVPARLKHVRMIVGSSGVQFSGTAKITLVGSNPGAPPAPADWTSANPDDGGPNLSQVLAQGEANFTTIATDDGFKAYVKVPIEADLAPGRYYVVIPANTFPPFAGAGTEEVTISLGVGPFECLCFETTTERAGTKFVGATTSEDSYVFGSESVASAEIVSNCDLKYSPVSWSISEGSTTGQVRATSFVNLLAFDAMTPEAFETGGAGGDGVPVTMADLSATRPKRLTVSPGDSEHPRLAIDHKDNIWLVFDSDRTGTDEVYVAKYFGRCGAWSSSAVGGDDKRISDFGPSGRAKLPKVAVDSAGDAHVVFQGTAPEDGKWEVYYTRSNGAGFTPPIRLTTSPGDAMMPDIVVAYPGGKPLIVVVWHDTRFGEMEIMSATKQDGVWTSSGQGGSDIRVTQSPGGNMFPRLAADKNSNIRLVYHSGRLGADHVAVFMSTRAAEGGSWVSSAQGGLDRLISQNPDGTAAQHADIDVDCANGPLVVWHDNRINETNPDKSQQEIFAAACARVAPADPTSACVPAIVTDVYGRFDFEIQVVDCINFEPIDSTNVPEICVRVKAPTATFYRVANEDGQFSPWQPFQPTVDLDTLVAPWSLTCGAGAKEVCVQVQDSVTVSFPVCKEVIMTSVPPKFDIEFFEDTEFLKPLPKYRRWPAIRAGDVFVRITASEPVFEPPTFDVISRGGHLVFNQKTELVGELGGTTGIGSFIGAASGGVFTGAGGTVYRGRFAVLHEDGCFHVDGFARVVVHGRDVCGNPF